MSNGVTVVVGFTKTVDFNITDWDLFAETIQLELEALILTKIDKSDFEITFIETDTFEK